MNLFFSLMGLILSMTLMDAPPSTPVYPIKPVLAAEQVPHMATAWNGEWIAAARPHFVRKQGAAGGGYLALIGLAAVCLIVWIQAKRELGREERGPDQQTLAGPIDGKDRMPPLAHALASRWGLR